jgi:ribonuclease P protein component
LVGRNKLPRSLSLKSRAEIDSLFANGRRIPTDFFTLIWQPADDFKYGIFVSRHAGKATRRNRIKRRFREAVRLSRDRLSRSVWVGFLPREVDREPELERLIADVSRVFEQLSSEK